MRELAILFKEGERRLNSIFFTDNSEDRVIKAKQMKDICSNFGFFLKEEIKEELFVGFEDAYFVPFTELWKIKRDVYRLSNNKFASDFIVLYGSIMDFYPFAELKNENMLKCPVYLITDVVDIPLKEEELFVLDCFDKVYFKISDLETVRYLNVLKALFDSKEIVYDFGEKKYEIIDEIEFIKKDIISNSEKHNIRLEAKEI